jgi:hypothetical protein
MIGKAMANTKANLFIVLTMGFKLSSYAFYVKG